jgi:hypothetical protein
MTLEIYCQLHDEKATQAERDLVIKEARKKLCNIDRLVFEIHVIQFNNFKNQEYENKNPN